MDPSQWVATVCNRTAFQSVILLNSTVTLDQIQKELCSGSGDTATKVLQLLGGYMNVGNLMTEVSIFFFVMLSLNFILLSI